MTTPIQDDASATDILQYLLDHWGLKNHNQLADEMGIDRRTVNQFANRKGTNDFLCKIVKMMSVDIEYLEKQRS